MVAFDAIHQLDRKLDVILTEGTVKLSRRRRALGRYVNPITV